MCACGATRLVAHREGVDTALIESDEESQQDIRRRMHLAYAGPKERANAIRVAQGKVERSEQTEPLCGDGPDLGSPKGRPQPRSGSPERLGDNFHAGQQPILDFLFFE